MPEKNFVEVRVGDVLTVNYIVVNESAHETVGNATYNVSPPTVGDYFSKINCFCFTEQRLKPGERREMPVVFFIDPKIAEGFRTRRSEHDHAVLHHVSGAPERAANCRQRWRGPEDRSEHDELTERLPMADAHAKQHDYHLVDPSPWPIVGSISAFVMALGAIFWMHHMLPGRAVSVLRAGVSASSTR